MARTLRLPERIEAELRRRAKETGRSQHEIIVATLAAGLGLETGGDPRLDDPAVRPPRTRGKIVARPVTLQRGVTALDLLDREDRL